MTTEEKSLKILDVNTLTISMPDGNHVHLGSMECEDARGFIYLIDDLYNYFCEDK
ncbi:hypothetical protein LCGC14_0342650 [marine sediment metagenome]|uniref:Uncharacterized protein n=1 Tax=marine sediment metagenome TaxID=412755 RepID=A0A0F9TWB3_9ZZZZ